MNNITRSLFADSNPRRMKHFYEGVSPSYGTFILSRTALLTESQHASNRTRVISAVETELFHRRSSAKGVTQRGVPSPSVKGRNNSRYGAAATRVDMADTKDVWYYAT